MSAAPSYLQLAPGCLEEKVRQARALLGSCVVCPRQCRVDRLNGELGYCGIGAEILVSSVNLHFGEEPPLSGGGGSGTIFLTGCNLHCLFCQNYPISQQGAGKPMTVMVLAEAMLSLQLRGAENINFVTPSHVVPQLLAAIQLASEKGLNLPLVYNSNGYEGPEALALLEDVIDIFLPDFKYADPEVALEYSDAPDYPAIAERSIAEMYRQVGPLKVDERGIAQRGLIVRHLILPEGKAGSGQVMARLAARIGTDIDISLMTQYFPAHKAYQYVTLSRKINSKETKEALIGFDENRIQRSFFQGDAEDT